MLDFIGSHFLYIPIVACICFMVVLGYVSWEDAARRKRTPMADAPKRPSDQQDNNFRSVPHARRA